MVVPPVILALGRLRQEDIKFGLHSEMLSQTKEGREGGKEEGNLDS
jgi:hypothetical protein